MSTPRERIVARLSEQENSHHMTSIEALSRCELLMHDVAMALLDVSEQLQAVLTELRKPTTKHAVGTLPDGRTVKVTTTETR